MKHFTEYTTTLNELRSRLPELAAVFDTFGGVSDVLKWMETSGRAKAAVDMISQDEFEYDFLIALNAQGEWLSFGLT